MGIFRRKNRLEELLEQAEELAEMELKREEVLANLVKYSRSLIALKVRRKVQKELRDNPSSVANYLERALFIVKRIRRILGPLINGNELVLQNALAIKEEAQKKTFLHERSRILSFSTIRCRERQAIKVLLGEAYASVERIIGIIERTLKEGLGNINIDEVIDSIRKEREAIIKVAENEFKDLGLEARDFEQLLELENLTTERNRGAISRLETIKKWRKWKGRIRKISIALASIYIAAGIALPAYATIYYSYPLTTKRIYEQQFFINIGYNDVVYSAVDGVKNHAIFLKNKNNMATDKAVVFVHGKDSNASGFYFHMRELHKNVDNVDLLSINLRGHGWDKDTAEVLLSKTTLGITESYDVLGALQWLAERGYKEIVIHGHSIGGAAVLKALGNPKYKNYVPKEINIRGVVIEKTFANIQTMTNTISKNYGGNAGLNTFSMWGLANKTPRIILPVPELQKKVFERLMGLIGRFNPKDVNPAEDIKGVEAPILLVYSPEDIIVGKDDAKIMEGNARNAKLVIVPGRGNLFHNHEVENTYPPLKAEMEFINWAMGLGLDINEIFYFLLGKF